ncbi:MAG TPA: LysM peptidoglycan-binding domain-containing protein [Candidatus Limnocylindria bacterium]|nr:LysM peptidoglycan-binding domain-containing protein [Candidatus Limnocylindria bacterium]
MTQRGELFGESPQACPFIALELDRDRRSDKPDYRHRCFAEPTPQPRAIAHQEAYCVSSEFASCPIFQGWAMRAAARPVPVPAGYEGRPAQPQAPMQTVAEVQAAARQAPLPVDVEPVVPAPGEAWPSDTFSPAPPLDTPAQLSAFEPADAGFDAADAQSIEAAMPSGSAAPFQPAPPVEQELPSAWSTSPSPAVPAFLQGVAAGAAGSADEPRLVSEPLDDAPVPGFLAGRPERAPAARSAGRPPAGLPRSSKPETPYRESVSREDLVPSWDLTGQYGADLNDDRGGRRGRMDDEGAGGGDRFGGLITAIAVIAILALGVAGVLFLPGLLAGHPAPTPTPGTSIPPTVFGSPTLPVATITPIASVLPTAQPTATPSPEVTPRLYRIKSGDTLGKIASRFHVSIADILAANPQISDADHIIPGQVITIPQPAP